MQELHLSQNRIKKCNNFTRVWHIQKNYACKKVLLQEAYVLQVV